ncbi:MAG: ABC transporter substrate-binding protein [Alphaproteobacteria bacterium]|nr:MAG: ABC transporter substrate-binding protein [Alphaproteobacteria bacterium]
MHRLGLHAAVCGALLLLGHVFAAPRAHALDNVALITDFGYNGRHAYFFVAIEKGYYKDADLDVKVVRGQGSVDAIRQVGANNAVVGFADAGSLVLARGNDQIPVKLVSIVYARPPQAIFCREDSGLKKPKDLEGASIANPAGGATVDMFPLYAKAAGFDAAKVKWVIAGSDSLPGLLASNRVPCVGQFTVGEPLLRMQAAPAKLVRFAFADAGVNFYGNGIIATDATIATKPDLVRRFVAATIRGMADAFADPEEAGRIMHKHHPTVEVAVAKGETEAVAELAQDKGQPLGLIDPARVAQTIEAVSSVFKLKIPVGVNDVFAPGFVK